MILANILIHFYTYFRSDSDEAMEDLAIKNKQLQSDILKLDSAKNKVILFIYLNYLKIKLITAIPVYKGHSRDHQKCPL